MPLFLLVIFLEIAFSQTTCSANSKCITQSVKCCAKTQSSTTGTCKTKCSGKTPFEIVFIPTTTTTTTLRLSTTTTTTAVIPTQPPISCNCPINTADVNVQYNSRYTNIYTTSALPPGLELTLDMCSISGVPSAVGVYTFDIMCADTRCLINTNRKRKPRNTVSAQCSITVV